MKKSENTPKKFLIRKNFSEKNVTFCKNSDYINEVLDYECGKYGKSKII